MSQDAAEAVRWYRRALAAGDPGLRASVRQTLEAIFREHPALRELAPDGAGTDGQ